MVYYLRVVCYVVVWLRGPDLNRRPEIVLIMREPLLNVNLGYSGISVENLPLQSTQSSQTIFSHRKRFDDIARNGGKRGK